MCKLVQIKEVQLHIWICLEEAEDVSWSQVHNQLFVDPILSLMQAFLTILRQSTTLF
jgi:hypothetical protein